MIKLIDDIIALTLSDIQQCRENIRLAMKARACYSPIIILISQQHIKISQQELKFWAEKRNEFKQS